MGESVQLACESDVAVDDCFTTDNRTGHTVVNLGRPNPCGCVSVVVAEHAGVLKVTEMLSQCSCLANCEFGASTQLEWRAPNPGQVDCGLHNAATRAPRTTPDPDMPYA